MECEGGSCLGCVLLWVMGFKGSSPVAGLTLKVRGVSEENQARKGTGSVAPGAQVYVCVLVCAWKVGCVCACRPVALGACSL